MKREEHLLPPFTQQPVTPLVLFFLAAPRPPRVLAMSTVSRSQRRRARMFSSLSLLPTPHISAGALHRPIPVSALASPFFLQYSSDFLLVPLILTYEYDLVF